MNNYSAMAADNLTPARPRWADLPDGPRTAYTHGPDGLLLGRAGTIALGPIFETTAEAAEEARKTAKLSGQNRVVYKLVPVSWHRHVAGEVW